jgi:hypothetical protein
MCQCSGSVSVRCLTALGGVGIIAHMQPVIASPRRKRVAPEVFRDGQTGSIKNYMGIRLRELEPRARMGVIAIFAVMFSVLIYGVVRYPDAPIQECRAGTGYCGKHNTVRTMADYQAFKRWETCLIILWPIGFISLIALSGRKQKVS